MLVLPQWKNARGKYFLPSIYSVNVIVVPPAKFSMSGAAKGSAIQSKVNYFKFYIKSISSFVKYFRFDVDCC